MLSHAGQAAYLRRDGDTGEQWSSSWKKYKKKYFELWGKYIYRCYQNKIKLTL